MCILWFVFNSCMLGDEPVTSGTIPYFTQEFESHIFLLYIQMDGIWPFISCSAFKTLHILWFLFRSCLMWDGLVTSCTNVEQAPDFNSHSSTKFLTLIVLGVQGPPQTPPPTWGCVIVDTNFVWKLKKISFLLYQLLLVSLYSCYAILQQSWTLAVVQWPTASENRFKPVTFAKFLQYNLYKYSNFEVFWPVNSKV